MKSDKIKKLMRKQITQILPIKKSITLLTAMCFLMTSVFSQGIYGFASPNTMPLGIKEISSINNQLIPFNIGKITDALYSGKGKIVINIQDLHSHEQTQRNISTILSILDNKYGLDKVYVEGAVGKVETGWLSKIKDEQIKKVIVNNLLTSGRLTGSEYYAVEKGKENLLEGIENKKIYVENLKRLKEIYEKKDEIESYIPYIENILEKTSEKYYTRENIRLNKIIKENKQGKLRADKYFEYLIKATKRANIDLRGYGSIVGFIKLLDKQKELKKDKINEEISQLLNELKGQLTYAQYKELTEKIGRKSQESEFYYELAKTVQKEGLLESNKYKNAKIFFEYIILNQELNPIELAKQEKRLLEELNYRFASTGAEKEIYFLKEYVGYMSGYLNNKLTAEEYEYFIKHIDDFKLLWAKYIDIDGIIEVTKYFELFDKFYKENVERNRQFVKSIIGQMPKEAEEGIRIRANIDHKKKVLEEIGESKQISVVVTGGFHTYGFNKLLAEEGISYIVITPNITEETLTAEKKYESIFKEQETVLYETLQKMLISQIGIGAVLNIDVLKGLEGLSEPLEIEILNEMLKEVTKEEDTKILGISRLDEGYQIKMTSKDKATKTLVIEDKEILKSEQKEIVSNKEIKAVLEGYEKIEGLLRKVRENKRAGIEENISLQIDEIEKIIEQISNKVIKEQFIAKVDNLKQSNKIKTSKKFILMGGPGAGKGTVAQLLTDKYQTAQISTGNLLRQAAKTDPKIKAIIESGELVQDSDVIDLIVREMARLEAQGIESFIFDGFPRTSVQAEMMLKSFIEKGWQDDMIFVHLDVPLEIIQERLAGRVTCENKDCGASYNINNPEFAPKTLPNGELVCPKCGSKVSTRSDDTPSGIEKRWNIYQDNIKPLLSIYQQNGFKIQKSLKAIDAFNEISSTIDTPIKLTLPLVSRISKFIAKIFTKDNISENILESKINAVLEAPLMIILSPEKFVLMHYGTKNSQSRITIEEAIENNDLQYLEKTGYATRLKGTNLIMKYTKQSFIKSVKDLFVVSTGLTSISVILGFINPVLFLGVIPSVCIGVGIPLFAKALPENIRKHLAYNRVQSFNTQLMLGHLQQYIESLIAQSTEDAGITGTLQNDLIELLNSETSIKYKNILKQKDVVNEIISALKTADESKINKILLNINNTINSFIKINDKSKVEELSTYRDLIKILRNQDTKLSLKQKYKVSINGKDYFSEAVSEVEALNNAIYRAANGKRLDMYLLRENAKIDIKLVEDQDTIYSKKTGKTVRRFAEMKPGEYLFTVVIPGLNDIPELKEYQTVYAHSPRQAVFMVVLKMFYDVKNEILTDGQYAKMPIDGKNKENIQEIATKIQDYYHGNNLGKIVKYHKLNMFPSRTNKPIYLPVKKHKEGTSLYTVIIPELNDNKDLSSYQEVYAYDDKDAVREAVLALINAKYRGEIEGGWYNNTTINKQNLNEIADNIYNNKNYVATKQIKQESYKQLGLFDSNDLGSIANKLEIKGMWEKIQNKWWVRLLEKTNKKTSPQYRKYLSRNLAISIAEMPRTLNIENFINDHVNPEGIRAAATQLNTVTSKKFSDVASISWKISLIGALGIGLTIATGGLALASTIAVTSISLLAPFIAAVKTNIDWHYKYNNTQDKKAISEINNILSELQYGSDKEKESYDKLKNIINETESIKISDDYLPFYILIINKNDEISQKIQKINDAVLKETWNKINVIVASRYMSRMYVGNDDYNKIVQDMYKNVSEVRVMDSIEELLGEEYPELVRQTKIDISRMIEKDAFLTNEERALSNEERQQIIEARIGELLKQLEIYLRGDISTDTISNKSVSFGTAGFRGIIGETFDFDGVALIAQAMSNIINSDSSLPKAVFFGNDTRFLGKWYSMVMERVFTANGIKVYTTSDKTGAVATPSISCYLKEVMPGKFAASLNVTASHNPKEYNGVKPNMGDGAPALPAFTKQITEEIQSIQKQIKAGNKNVIKVSKKENTVTLNDIDAKHFEYLITKLDSLIGIIRERFAAEKATNIGIVVDGKHTALMPVLKQLLDYYGFTNVEIFNETRDVAFDQYPPEPNESNTKELKTKVLAGKKKFNGKTVFGIATDPDGDRFCIYDADGSFISPNEVGLIAADQLLSNLIAEMKLKKEKGELTAEEINKNRAVIVKSLVTTFELNLLAEYYSKEFMDIAFGEDEKAKEEYIKKNGNPITIDTVSVGWKNIADAQKTIESNGERYLMGVESSGGLSVGLYDKDGGLATMMPVLIAAQQDKTFKELLSEARGRTKDASVFKETAVKFPKEVETEIEKVAGDILDIEVIGSEEDEDESINIKSKISQADKRKYIVDSMAKVELTEKDDKWLETATTEEKIKEIASTRQKALLEWIKVTNATELSELLKKLGMPSKLKVIGVKVLPNEGVQILIADSNYKEGDVVKTLLTFRASGTEPLVRVYAETTETDLTNTLSSIGENIVKGTFKPEDNKTVEVNEESKNGDIRRVSIMDSIEELLGKEYPELVRQTKIDISRMIEKDAFLTNEERALSNEERQQIIEARIGELLKQLEIYLRGDISTDTISNKSVSFGTAGFRGIIGETFDFDGVALIAQAMSNIINSDSSLPKAVFFGNDTRFLGKWYSMVMERVFTANGIKVYTTSDKTGAVATPSISCYLKEVMPGKFAASLNVTASHNPKEYNGVKPNMGDGAPALPAFTKQITEEIQSIQKQIKAGNKNVIKVSKKENTVTLNDIDAKHFEYLITKLDSLIGIIRERFAAEKATNIGIVVDGKHTALMPVLKQLLDYYGFTNVEIFNETRDVAFDQYPPEPNESNTKELKTKVLAGKKKFNGKTVFGIATDPDGDRFCIYDADGSFISPNEVGLIAADQLLSNLIAEMKLKKEKGELTAEEINKNRAVIVKSLVTTFELNLLAEYYSKEFMDIAFGEDEKAKEEYIKKNGNPITIDTVSVGWKNIADAQKTIESNGERYLMGVESSGGLSVGLYDKDGGLATMMPVLIAAQQDKTFKELLSEARGRTKDASVFKETAVKFPKEVETEIEKVAGDILDIEVIGSEEDEDESINIKSKISQADKRKYIVDSMAKVELTEKDDKWLETATTEEKIKEIASTRQKALLEWIKVTNATELSELLKKLGMPSKLKVIGVKVLPNEGVQILIADSNYKEGDVVKTLLTFRASGTEPLVRVYAETTETDLTNTLSSIGENIVKGAFKGSQTISNLEIENTWDNIKNTLWVKLLGNILNRKNTIEGQSKLKNLAVAIAEMPKTFNLEKFINAHSDADAVREQAKILNLATSTKFSNVAAISWKISLIGALGIGLTIATGGLALASTIAVTAVSFLSPFILSAKTNIQWHYKYNNNQDTLIVSSIEKALTDEIDVADLVKEEIINNSDFINAVRSIIGKKVTNEYVINYVRNASIRDVAYMLLDNQELSNKVINAIYSENVK
ncbi:MAG: nucleoside monophosphate kinase, partial [Endomicrobiaceae bacterium]|nr:nucleoside monophosphate kinase [Endomicrobiaceae bacterium]